MSAETHLSDRVCCYGGTAHTPTYWGHQSSNAARSSSGSSFGSGAAIAADSAADGSGGPESEHALMRVEAHDTILEAATISSDPCPTAAL